MVTSFNEISGILGSLFFSGSLLVCVFMVIFVFLSSELSVRGEVLEYGVRKAEADGLKLMG